MNQTDILTLYDYTYWARDRVLRAAQQLTPEQFATPLVTGQGSIRATLVHALSAERNWRIRCQERVSPTGPLAEADYATLEILTEQWHEEEARMRGYLAALTDEALQETMRYRTTQGVPFEHPLWQALFQAVNHGTQHRSEVALLLTAHGASPGDLDFIVYLRER